MTAIDNYVKYWDDWHSDWFKEIKSNSPKEIKGWKVPYEKGGNDNPICQYFPEPYWGNPNSEKLSAIFLNINPGGGGESQNILTMDLDESNPYKAYKNNKFYSNAVKELSAISDYKTTEWMQKWRVNWLREILDNKSISVSEIFCAELIPWHTKKKSDISDYAIKNKTPNLINDDVITHLSKIAQSKTVISEMQGKVIVRSSLILDILNSIHKINPTSLKINDIENFAIIDNVKDKNNKAKLLTKFNSYLTIFKIDKTSFYVFSGGSNSALPNPAFTVFSIGQNISNRKTDISLKEFMKS